MFIFLDLLADMLVQLDGSMASAWGKMPGQALRLALVLEHLWWAAPPLEGEKIGVGWRRLPQAISEKSVGMAIKLIDGYFKPMARRVYGDAGLPQAYKSAAVLGRWILREKPTTLNVRHMRRKVRLENMNETHQVQRLQI